MVRPWDSHRLISEKIKQTNVYVKCNLTWKMEREKKKFKEFNTYTFKVCQCRALQVWRRQAHLKLAAALGSGMGRSLYEVRLCAEEINQWYIKLTIN